jgi:hypothetical protein
MAIYIRRENDDKPMDLGVHLCAAVLCSQLLGRAGKGVVTPLGAASKVVNPINHPQQRLLPP